MVRWEDAFDAIESKNSRGEKVYDIFRKGTQDMLWADIPENKLEDFKKVMTDYAERILSQDLEDILTEEQQVEKTKDSTPMEVTYNRLRDYRIGHAGFMRFDDEDDE